MTYEFTVPGPLVGAVRTTQRQKWVDPRYKRYAAFKQLVRLIANGAGVPQELAPTDSAHVTIVINWVKRARADADNCAKGLLDSLWKQDRRVTMIVVVVNEHQPQENMVVTVEVFS